MHKLADTSQRPPVNCGRDGVARKAASEMIVWTCIIAGGPDDGRIVLGWYPKGQPELLVLQDSTGMTCKAVVIGFNREFSYAIFRHETATPGQLTRAEAALKVVVDKLRNGDAPTSPTGKRKKPGLMSVLLARVFAEASTCLAAVQAVSLPAMRPSPLL